MPIHFVNFDSQIPTVDQQVQLIYNEKENYFALNLLVFNRADDHSMIQIQISSRELPLTAEDLAVSKVVPLDFGVDLKLASHFQVAILQYAHQHENKLDQNSNKEMIGQLIKIGLNACHLDKLENMNNDDLLKYLMTQPLLSSKKIEDFDKMNFVACLPNLNYDTADIEAHTEPCAAIVSQTARTPDFFHKNAPKEKTNTALFKDESKTYFDDSLASRLLPYSSLFAQKPRLTQRGNFQRMGSIYAFRGDTRSVNEIHEAGGFWPNFTRPGVSKFASEGEFDISSHQGGNVETSALISFSFGIREASHRADDQYYYVVDVIGGYTTKHRDSEDEITAVGGVDFQNVVAFRKGNHEGPIYIKKEFFENHRETALELLSLMNGKKQYTLNQSVEFVDYENKKFGWRDQDDCIVFTDMYTDDDSTPKP